jgi:hypothetical protein
MVIYLVLDELLLVLLHFCLRLLQSSVQLPAFLGQSRVFLALGVELAGELDDALLLKCLFFHSNNKTPIG